MTTQAPTRTNGPAVASLALGVLSFVLLAIVLGSLAVIFGHVALDLVKNSGAGGKGMAIAGLTLGYITTVIAIISLLSV